MRFLFFITITALSICQFYAPTASSTPFQATLQKPDFNKDIRPIFESRCIQCHGKDKLKGGLKLDRKTDTLAGGNSGKIIVAGKPEESELIRRLMSTDAEIQMPPKGERLSEAETARIQQWIKDGAQWPDDQSTQNDATVWWSFQPLQKIELPIETKKSNREIDYFVQKRLKEKGLASSPRADRRTLIRRLYFDLTGLPPSLEEVESFFNDQSKDAYEKLVDRLLASPRYGERWARHWFDVVHYGETHGYDKDQPRPNAWPYRDYVIRSLNADKPYDRFVREQIAGDVLYPFTRDGLEALGFLSAGPWDFIGHVEVSEDKIDGKIARHLDRDDMVANTINTFMGLTVHCAQCHNHKFDPISQEDYYRLQAVFAAIDRTNKSYDADMATATKRSEFMRIRSQAEFEVKTIESLVKKTAGEKWNQIEQQISNASKPPKSINPAEHGYHSAIASKADQMKWVIVDLGTEVKIDRIVLHACHDDFNSIGDGFGFPIRFKVELSSELSFDTDVKIISDQTKTDFTNPGIKPVTYETKGITGRFLRITATKLASRLPNDFIFALAEVEAFDPTGVNRALGANVKVLDSIEAPSRWSKSNLTDGKFPISSKENELKLKQLLKQRDEIILNSIDQKTHVSFMAAKKTILEMNQKITDLPKQSTAYVGAIHQGTGSFKGTGAAGGTPRPIYMLPRGDVRKPGREIAPGFLSSMPGIKIQNSLDQKSTDGERRAALAQWLTDRDNPLTWRVMANRIWQFHFGRGLLDTPNDFGKMGQSPSHPELLDWLANDLRENQSLKRLHRIIVLSETYQQVSTTDAKKVTIDAENQFVWRQNRRKLEAEAVRDSILLVAGKLDLTMGGASYQDFIVEKPEHSPHYEYHLHNPDDPKSHRRTIYRTIVRSNPQPFLAALDCADPSQAVEKRNQTQTPQQALSLLNNSLTIVMAKHFADRVEATSKDDDSRIEKAFVFAIGRKPTDNELKLLIPYLKKHGLANTCRMILNLNEFVFVD